MNLREEQIYLNYIKNNYSEEPPPYRIPMKSTGSVGVRGITDENSLIEQRESFLSEIKGQILI